MLRRLGTLVAASAMAVAGTVFVAPTASARACLYNYYCAQVFYSDAAHSEVVGRVITYCDGTEKSYGTWSAYSTRSEAPCY